MFQRYPENFAFQLFPREICNFLKKWRTFQQFLLSSVFINKTLRLNNFKTRRTMNVKMSVVAIFVAVIIYLLKYDLHDRTFKSFFLHFLAVTLKVSWRPLTLSWRRPFLYDNGPRHERVKDYLKHWHQKVRK